MRRKYVTHPHFQFAFTSSFVLGVISIFLILGGLTVAMLYLLSGDPALTAQQQMFLSSETLKLVYVLAFAAVLLLLIFIFVGLYMSYKFVGPLYRLESWLADRIANRDFLPLTLRPGDELEKVVIAINRLIQRKFGGNQN